jgi:hypothetical protein
MILLKVALNTKNQSILLFCSKKRTTSVESNGASGKKYNRKDVTLYSPPGGKFSDRAGTYQPGKINNY